MANPQAQNQQPKTPQAAAAAGMTTKRGETLDSAAAKISNILSPNAKPKAAQAGEPAQGKKPKAKAAPPAQPPQKAPKAPKAAPKGQAAGAEVDLEAGEAGADDAAEHDPFAVSDPDAEHDAEEADGDPEADAAEGEEGEEGDEEAEDDGTLYTVKVNGEELEVPLSELIKGYSRTADYQQKTMALAKQRKEVEALQETVKDLPQQRETYVKSTERFTQAAAVMMTAMQHKFMPKPPDPAMAKTDPAGYFAAKEAHQDALQFTNALDQEIGKIQKDMEADGKRRHAKAVQEGRAKLYQAMPEMNNLPARQKLREYANSLGFTDEQIQQEASHTLFICVEKARKWDELQAQKANAKPKPPVSKVVKRTNAQQAARAATENNKAGAFASHAKGKTLATAEKALAHILSNREE